MRLSPVRHEPPLALSPRAIDRPLWGRRRFKDKMIVGDLSTRDNISQADGAYALWVTDLVVARPGEQRQLVSRVARMWRDALVGIGFAGLVAATAAANGAYFPTAWGWTALAVGAIALVGLLVLPVVRLDRFDLTAIWALWALVGWTALSAVWSLEGSQSILESERTLVYATLLAAVVILVGGRAESAFAGVALAIAGVCSYSLATRLFPEHFGFIVDPSVNRLERPIGYWNSLGTFAAMGLVVSLGFAARAKTLFARALASGALPLLAVTLYFTFGRAAWVALFSGLALMLAIDRRRLELVGALILVAPWPAIAVWAASRKPALTSREPLLGAATQQGHAFAPVLVGLSAAACVAGLVLALLQRRLPPLGRGRIALGAGLWLATAVAATGLFVSYGAPWSLVGRGYRSFTRTPPAAKKVVPTQAANLNNRLFSLWGNGRADYWRVAWNDAEKHLWAGSGAGTYQAYWLRHRPFPGQVRDAHSLYIEVLAELGFPGLVLLLVVVAVPFAAALRARALPYTAPVLGAFSVYVLHAGVDWDWEVTAVTLAAIALGGALKSYARRDGSARPLGLGRLAHAAVVLAALCLAFVGLVGNTAMSSSRSAAQTEDWPRAESRARKAIQWAPWSAAAWQQLGEVQLQQAKLAAARMSFRKGIAKDANSWNLWLDLAFASSGPAAHRAALTAYRLNPRSPEIAAVRGRYDVPSPPR
jgi:O-antigen ligase/polysaccharide polymerase Wzy-like membrane protein